MDWLVPSTHQSLKCMTLLLSQVDSLDFMSWFLGTKALNVARGNAEKLKQIIKSSTSYLGYLNPKPQTQGIFGESTEPSKSSKLR